jgi:general secretion pathway protein H
MVVMIIIGVILSFTTLSIGGFAPNLEQEAQRLASLLKLASQETIMQSKEMGVSFKTEGYRFYVLQEQEWQTITARDDIFRPRSLPLGMQIEIRLDGQSIEAGTNNTPQLLLLSSGEMTPFEVIFTAESDEKLRYRLIGTATGELGVQKY